MSRHLSPVLSSHGAAPWPDTVGLYAMEGGYHAGDGSRVPAVRRLVLVLDFNEISRHRILLRKLCGTTRHVIERHQIVSRPEVVQQLSAFVQPCGDVPAAVVVALPDDDAGCSEAVEAALASLRAHTGLAVDLVIGVAKHPPAWSGLAGVRHFLAHGIHGPVQSVVTGVRLAASLMAPVAILAADASEIAQCLGTAASPSHVFPTRWMNHEAAQPLAQDVPRDLLHHASRCLVLNEGFDGSARLAARVTALWHALCPAASPFAAIITQGFFAPEMDDAPEQPVVAVCTFEAGVSPDDPLTYRGAAPW